MEKEISLIKQKLDRPLVITGMMGSGKTFIGSKIAEALNCSFYDSDRIVEQKAGRSINDIFEEFGERKFRESEQKTICSLLDEKQAVISTGGGAVLSAQTRTALKKKAVCLWLNVNDHILLSRLKHSKNRPLLMDDDPQKVISSLLKERTPYYREADIIVEINNELPPQAIVESAIKSLYEFLNTARF